MTSPSLAARLFQYQKERFPLLAHLPLVAVLAAAGLRLAGGLDLARWTAMVVVLTGLFFQLRVADEFKDAETDRRFRPERPVPRGLISLRELAVLAGVVALLQLALTAWLEVALLPWLLLVHAYGAAMTVEFGIGDWLRARPLLYLLSHMAIMPLIGLFALRAGGSLPDAWAGFALLCYANGLVLEIGRKIRKPEDEREGVETYSALWGRRALVAWALAVVAAMICVAVMGHDHNLTVIFVVPVTMLTATLCRGHGKGMELASALWLLGSFGVLAMAGA